MTSVGNQQPLMNSKGPVLLCAGGTGGHMFPAFALARELQARGVGVAIVTDARGTKYQDQYPDLKFHTLRAETLRRGIVAKFSLLLNLCIGTAQAVLLCKKTKPCAVVGFGGYPSFPGVLAAQFLNIPTLLHEQNAVLGRANKMLAGGATRIALSLPDMKAIPKKWHRKTMITGNPVRADIAAIEAYVAPTDVFRLLVLGGSQGAKVFSDLVPEALSLLPENIRSKINIVQQCREGDIDNVRRAYDIMNVDARLESFVRDVPAQLAACHLIIARSGASTVTEVGVAGRPAIFVPYPHHKDQQQLVNAQVLERAGAAVVFHEKTMTAQGLAQEIQGLVTSPARLGMMAVAARGALMRDGAKNLADAVLSL